MPENSRKVRDVRKEAEVFGRKVHKANKEMGGKLMNLGARAARPRWWEESGWKVGEKNPLVGMKSPSEEKFGLD